MLGPEQALYREDLSSPLASSGKTSKAEAGTQKNLQAAEVLVEA